MKIYERKYTDFIYPDEMAKIMNYLNERGCVFVSGKTIEDLYFRFSGSRYSASWMRVCDERLEEFEEFLLSYDL